MNVPNPKHFTVAVTQDIIAAAKPRDSRHCMVAAAVRKQLNASSVDVTVEKILFNKDGFRWAYVPPAIVGSRIASFDDKKKVKPFSFQLTKRSCLGVRPVETRGPARKSKHSKVKRRRTQSVRRCAVRRYHGLKTIVKA